MMLNQLMTNTQLLLKNSPFHMDKYSSFLSKGEKDSFISNVEELNYLIANQLNPLKIVIMGEVKAGKSTLINSFVREEVSPVGISETTAVILEIGYGSNKQGKYFYKDGSSSESSLETVFDELNKNKENLPFYEKIDRVEITYPINELREIKIVDTPGLGTITQANEETTKNFIHKSDVVLWVLNLNHLGQHDTKLKMEEVVNYGKPVILLINRIDELDDNETSVDDIMEYIEDYYYDLYEVAFPVSAQKAFQGIQNNNIAMYKESGINAVLTYLKDNIEISAEDEKNKIDLNSLQHIIYKEINVIERIQKNNSFILTSIKRRKDDIEDFRKIINNNLKRDVDSVGRDFFIKEEMEIKSALGSGDKKLFSIDITNAENLYKDYISSDYLTVKANQYLQENVEKNNKKVKHAIEVVGTNIKKEAEKYKEEYQNLLLPVLQNDSVILSTTSDELVTGAKQGAFVGGAYGLAAAAYAALLGPYAAVVTIGAAISSFLPPVLLIGAATGAAIKFVNKDKKAKELEKHLTTKFTQIRMWFNDSIQKFGDELIEENDQTFDAIYQKICSHFLENRTLNDLHELEQELDTYYRELKQLGESVRRYI